MPWTDFWIILSLTALCTLLSRILPVVLFANRELPTSVMRSLEYIPVAAFAALVANDLFTPEVFSAGFLPAMLPFVALIPVIVVALKTKSLALCIVVGVAAFAFLQWAAVALPL